MTEVEDATRQKLLDEITRSNGASVTVGAALLDDVRAFVAMYVAFPGPAELDAVTLWAAHTHLVHEGENTPRLALLSPEPGSGKTRSLEVLELLVPNPMFALSASTPATFRSLAKGPRVLLFDEVDALFTQRGKDDSHEDLRALLNSGHRRGATIPRCVGPQHEVADFPVYAAAALAGLGDLPDTLMSRAIVVRMKRRSPSERITPFRRRLALPAGARLKARLIVWCASVARAVSDAWPEMPDGVSDRPADCWEPLLAIADAAGGHWPETARTACTALVKVAESQEASLGVKLLQDLRDVFDAAGTERLSTEDLLERLHRLEESPWADMRGKPLDARGLARRLRQYDVRPHQFKVADIKVRGYSIPGGDLDGGGLYDAFARYLPPSHPRKSGTDGTNGTGQLSVLEQVPDAGSGTGTRNLPGTSDKPLTRAVPDVPLVPDYAGWETEVEPDLSQQTPEAVSYEPRPVDYSPQPLSYDPPPVNYHDGFDPDRDYLDDEGDELPDWRAQVDYEDEASTFRDETDL